MDSIKSTVFRHFGWERLPLYSGKIYLPSRQMNHSVVPFPNSFTQSKPRHRATAHVQRLCPKHSPELWNFNKNSSTRSKIIQLIREHCWLNTKHHERPQRERHCQPECTLPYTGVITLLGQMSKSHPLMSKAGKTEAKSTEKAYFLNKLIFFSFLSPLPPPFFF